MVAALGGIDAALEAGERVDGASEDVAKGAFLPEAVPPLGVLQFGFPELGFDIAEPPQLPLSLDEGIDEEALLGRSRMEARVVVKSERFEGVGILAADDGGLGVDAGLQGVETGSSLALDGARASGLLSVSAIRLDLSWSGHKCLRFEGSRG
jgi:hypothetical protein